MQRWRLLFEVSRIEIYLMILVTSNGLFDFTGEQQVKKLKKSLSTVTARRKTTKISIQLFQRRKRHYLKLEIARLIPFYASIGTIKIQYFLMDNFQMLIGCD